MFPGRLYRLQRKTDRFSPPKSSEGECLGERRECLHRTDDVIRRSELCILSLVDSGGRRYPRKNLESGAER